MAECRWARARWSILLKVLVASVRNEIGKTCKMVYGDRLWIDFWYKREKESLLKSAKGEGVNKLVKEAYVRSSSTGDLLWVQMFLTGLW